MRVKTQDVDTCVTDSSYKLDYHAGKGLLDTVLQREPLTQLKRVEIENIVEQYQDKIDQQEFKKRMAEVSAR